MNRGEFMEYFRSEKFDVELSPDDKEEVFLRSLQGSDDITVELLNKLLSDYGVDDIKITKIKKKCIKY